MMQSGAIEGGSVHEAPANPPPKTVIQQPATPVHDLNVPYEATDDYEAPSADTLFPQVGDLGFSPLRDLSMRVYSAFRSSTFTLAAARFVRPVEFCVLLQASAL